MKNFPTRHRRGSVGLVVIIVLVLVQIAVVTVVLAGARDQDMTVKRLESIRAFYAAEAGMNMAIREVRENDDEDGDGGVGTISNDGNAGNNPSFGSATVEVNTANVNGEVEFYAVGAAGLATRQITSVMPPTGLTGTIGYLTPFSTGQLGVAGKQIATQVTAEEDGYVTSISARINGPPPKNTRYAIYSDSGGEPANLIVQTQLHEIGGTASTYHWLTLFVPSTFLAAGDYWLAMGVEHSNVEYSYNGLGGQFRMNDNDPTDAGGFDATWGTSTASGTRRVNMYANRMLQRAGPATFAGSSDYDNTNPPATGLFRDVTQPTLINRGDDISTNGTHYKSINFWQASGLVSDSLTVFDSTPADATPTTFEGSIRVTADVVFTGTSSARYFGLASMHSEISGQEGLVMVLREQSNQDRLILYRMPQTGDITGATAIDQTGNYNVISANNWYRLTFDIIESDGALTITGYVFSHSTASNPNSSINNAPIMELSYSTTVAALTGMSDIGEAGLVFDTTDATSRCSTTNVTIDYDPGANSGGYVSSWAEAEHSE